METAYGDGKISHIKAEEPVLFSERNLFMKWEQAPAGGLLFWAFIGYRMDLATGST